VARNALRHALSLPISSNPALSEEVEALASQIAGSSADAKTQELARRIAEAQIDLRRVRCARHRLLSDALSNEHYDSSANTRMKFKVICRLLSSKAPDMSMEALEKFVTSTPQGSHKFATILPQEAKQLLAMDRYERRALSRRKFAIRAFDATGRQAACARVAAGAGLNVRRSSRLLKARSATLGCAQTKFGRTEPK
jgi:hypothetical protein